MTWSLRNALRGREVNLKGFICGKPPTINLLHFPSLCIRAVAVCMDASELRSFDPAVVVHGNDEYRAARRTRDWFLLTHF